MCICERIFARVQLTEEASKFQMHASGTGVTESCEILDLIMCVHLCGNLCTCVKVPEEANKCQVPLELELHMVVSYWKWVLETELQFSVGVHSYKVS